MDKRKKWESKWKN